MEGLRESQLMIAANTMPSDWFSYWTEVRGPTSPCILWTGSDDDDYSHDAPSKSAKADSSLPSVTVWTWGAMEALSNRIAHWGLRVSGGSRDSGSENKGLGRGDAIALLMRNRPEYVPIWLGISKIGAATYLINPMVPIHSFPFSFPSLFLLFSFSSLLSLQLAKTDVRRCAMSRCFILCV
jgi:acyl-CoA synthetase (AMP-forming)/AMP-acid ligase II